MGPEVPDRDGLSRPRRAAAGRRRALDALREGSLRLHGLFVVPATARRSSRCLPDLCQPVKCEITRCRKTLVNKKMPGLTRAPAFEKERRFCEQVPQAPGKQQVQNSLGTVP